MRSLHLVFGVIVGVAFACVTPKEARAEKPKPTLFLTPGMVGSFTSEGKPLPPVALTTLIGSFPLNERWSAIGKVGYATPFALFQPAPHFQAGASYKVSDSFRLGGTALYRHVPHWTGTPFATNLVGAMLVPAFPVAGTKILVQLPTGMAYNTHTEIWSIATGIELAFPLPF